MHFVRLQLWKLHNRGFCIVREIGHGMSKFLLIYNLVIKLSYYFLLYLAFPVMLKNHDLVLFGCCKKVQVLMGRGYKIPTPVLPFSLGKLQILIWEPYLFSKLIPLFYTPHLFLELKVDYLSWKEHPLSPCLNLIGKFYPFEIWRRRKMEWVIIKGKGRQKAKGKVKI